MRQPSIPTQESDHRSPWTRLLREIKPEELSLDLVQVLQQLLKLLQEAAPDHAAGIFLLDEPTRTIQGQVTDLFDRDLSEGEGALQAALRNTASFVISNLDARPKTVSKGARSQIAIPFRASPRVRGALILRSRTPNAYQEQDGTMLSRFAVKASAAIENALIRQRMQHETVGEMDQDLVMAQEIMARLIPQKPPAIPGVDVASVNIPAKIVGGDMLDYIVLDEDHYGFLVADASGNGIPSALLMTGFRSLFRGLIQNEFNIRSVFRKANQQLVESTAPHQFVSAFYASLDSTTNRLIYVNGGHVPPLLSRPGQLARPLEVGGPVLGILPGASYHEDSIVLRPKDILVCYSDGLSEAENEAGTSFDTSRILEVIEAVKERSARGICAALREEAHSFVGTYLRDDLTICVLKFL